MNQLVVVAGRELVVIAKIGAPVGIKGWLRVAPVFLNSCEFEDLVLKYSKDVYLLKNNNFPKKLSINNISVNQKDIKIELEGVASRDQAQELSSYLVACSKDIYDSYLKNIKSIFLYLNYEVQDLRLGKIGTVVEISRQGQILFNVIDSSGRQVLIPFVDSFIKDINDEKKTILMDLPEGLV